MVIIYTGYIFTEEEMKRQIGWFFPFGNIEKVVNIVKGCYTLFVNLRSF